MSKEAGSKNPSDVKKSDSTKKLSFLEASQRLLKEKNLTSATEKETITDKEKNTDSAENLSEAEPDINQFFRKR